MSVMDVSQADFPATVLEESRRRPVVVDFWAAWCGPCRVLGPTLERLAAEGGGAWLLAKVDVDENPALAQRYGVQGIPTVIAFRDGEAINRFTGAVPESQIRSFLDSIVPDELDLETAAAERAFDRGDLESAEQGFRSVLARDPAHLEAGVGLVTLLLDRDDPIAAREILERLPKSDEVRRLEAVARMWASPGDLAALEASAAVGNVADRLALSRALASHGEYARAMQILVDIVGERGDHSEDARRTLLDLFEILGAEHRLVAEYRRKLASALF